MATLPISQESIQASLSELLRADNLTKQELLTLAAREDVLDLNARKMRQIIQEMRMRHGNDKTD